MTRAEAEKEVARLAAEHPDRGTHQWFARERDGDWSVVKVALPPGRRIDPLKATTEARPKPPYPDDHRSPQERLIPPYGAGGAG